MADPPAGRVGHSDTVVGHRVGHSDAVVCFSVCSLVLVFFDAFLPLYSLINFFFQGHDVEEAEHSALFNKEKIKGD